MPPRLRLGLLVTIVSVAAFAGCAGHGASTLPAAPTASPAAAAAAGGAPAATGPVRSAQAVVPTPSPNYVGYISYYWGDKTLWAINCDAPFYFPPNTCLAVHAANATQLGGPALAVHDFVSISADPATSGASGLTALTYTTSLTPFPGSPVWNGYTGPSPGPSPTANPNPTPTPTATPVPTPTPVATATPTGPATPPSTNYLGYVSYYWGDLTNFAINCDAPTYFPPNTCLAVNAGTATKYGSGPALAVGDFIAIYANPATSGKNGLIAITYATSLTPFAGSPLPKGYATPTPSPSPSASPVPTATPTATATPTPSPSPSPSPSPTVSPVPTATPTGPATPPSTNYLGYVSYYWGDLTKFAINCDAPYYFPPNTCLAVNAGSATKYGSGPAMAVGDFIAIYANPATAGPNGLTAISYATSATPFAGSPLPKGYTGPTPPPTPSPTPSSTPPGSAAMVDWPTYGYNNARTGESPDTTITTSNVKTLQLAWSVQNLDFNIEVQPIVATGVMIGGVSHDVVYVGGGSGTVYAFDAFTGGTPLWTRQLPPGSYACLDDNGNPGTPGPFGVAGTFALDRTNGALYVPDGVHTVHALDLATGADKWAPVNVAPGPSDDGSDENLREFLHTALTFSNGKIYGGTSSTCDLTPWRGRVFEIDAGSHALTTFYTVYNSAPPGQTAGAYGGGGVWGWGGVSTDGSSLYFGVGNTDTSTPQSSPYVAAPSETSGFGEHVVKLSTDLGTVQDSNWPNLSAVADDIDLSGTPMLFQPPGCTSPLLALQGKQGYLLIYNRSNLSNGPIATFETSPASDASHNLGVPAYSSQTHKLYASLSTGFNGYSPGMLIVSFAGCTPTSTTQASFGADSDSYGAANPRGTATIANGVAFMGSPDGILWARDATTGAALWDSNNTNGQNTYGLQWAANPAGDEIRPGPAVTGGWVFVTAMDSGSLYALRVSGAATSSAQRKLATSSALVTSATRKPYPLPAPPVKYRPPQRRHNRFGRTLLR